MIFQFFPSFPLRETLREYSFSHAQGDLFAGLTLAFFAVPQCMAYALIVGVSPIHGLYAALFGVVIGALFSSSRFLIAGPTGTISLVAGGIIYSLNPENPLMAVVLLTVLVGLLQIGFSFLQLGNLARFVAQSVISGFIVGTAVVIIGDQLIYLLQVGSVRSPYFGERVYQTITLVLARGSIPWPTVAVGGSAVLIMVLLRWVHSRIPAGLMTIILGSVLTYMLALNKQGIEIVGSIPAQLPGLVVPEVDGSLFRELFSGAFALALLGGVQAVSIARSLATSTREPIDENQELFSLGLANLTAGFFQGFPVSASFSRSFFNFSAGARSRVAGVFCGVFILATILFASPVAYYIPTPLLAGLIIVVISDILDWHKISMAVSTTYRDQLAFLATFVSVLLLQIDTAIYIGVGVSVVLYLRKASHLDLREYIVDENGELQNITDFESRIVSSVALIDVNGEAFFGSADRIKKRVEDLVEESPELKVIVLRMKNAMNLDITSVISLKDIALTLEDQDRTLMICGATPQIREVLDESGVSEVIGEDKILVAQTSLLESTRQAIERAQAHIDSVLEGNEDRDEEEEPPLKHTLEQVKEEEKGKKEPEEEPIEDERVQPDE